jgi:hypothetical protein
MRHDTPRPTPRNTAHVEEDETWMLIATLLLVAACAYLGLAL